jgi:hypothetical protein
MDSKHGRRSATVPTNRRGGDDDVAVTRMAVAEPGERAII